MADAKSDGKGVHERSAKEKRYDRQMRLWGAHGQRRLEHAHVCVLGSGATATEALKNLVLPCIGNWTLVDDAVVTEGDLGNNFFVEEEALGKSRAQTVCALMMEMNKESHGTAVVKNPVDIITKELAFFNKFSLVIATQLSQRPLLTLANHLNGRSIPLVALRTEGMIGYARLQIDEQIIWESHPDDERYELFLHPTQLEKFPELKTYISSFGDISKLSEDEFNDVPFPVLLVDQLAKWQAKHGSIPSDSKSKDKFKDQIRKATRVGDETNFTEAAEHAVLIYRTPELKEEVQAVFADEKGENVTRTSSSFWILVKAVRQFFKQEGVYPCVPALPDMHTKSESYVKLQRIFLDRADRDVGIIEKFVKAIIKEVKSEVKIDREDVEYFCRNYRTIAFLRTRQFSEEYTAATFQSDEFNEILEEVDYEGEADPEDENSQIPKTKDHYWYLALRIFEIFRAKHGRFAGSEDKSLSADVKELETLGQAFLTEYKLRAAAKPLNMCLQEMVRARGEEVHNVAALIGGVGAQMALKLLLQQFIPTNNTFIFNGVHGSGLTIVA